MQVLAKSSKMIPVMLAGTFIYGRQYAPAEYMCTLLVAGGVSVFALFKVLDRTFVLLRLMNAGFRRRVSKSFEKP